MKRMKEICDRCDGKLSERLNPDTPRGGAWYDRVLCIAKYGGYSKNDLPPVCKYVVEHAVSQEVEKK